MSSASQSDCPIARSFVLDGDGSLLMNLGSLVTIAGVAPANLTHFVCQSGCYEANGDHPIPGQDRVSFAGFARASGYRAVTEFSNLDMCTELPAFLRAHGPSFATLHVRSGEKPNLDYALMHGADARR